MSENKQSFWSTIPGLVTGLAGLLTGIVGLVTVLMQLDILGGNGDNGSGAAVTTTVAPGATGGASATTISGRLTAEPTTLKLATGEREKTLRVVNNASATVTVLQPEFKGRDSSAFSADSGCTNLSLRAGASCTVKIKLSPSGALKTYEASLVLEGKEISQVTEVPITASTIL